MCCHTLAAKGFARQTTKGGLFHVYLLGADGNPDLVLKTSVADVLRTHGYVRCPVMQLTSEPVLVGEPMFRIGASTEAEPGTAIAELRRQIVHPKTALALLFISSRHNKDAIAASVQREFAGVKVIGCSTAGEIGPFGYFDGGISGLSFGCDDVVFEAGLIEGVARIDHRKVQAFAYELRQRLVRRSAQAAYGQRFAVLLIDGLSGHEEHVARAVHDGLGGIPMVGGSAGDGMGFEQTTVMYDGRFHTDAAVLLVVATPYPFTIFKTQHFVCGEKRMVVTGAVPERRLVTEIDGFPAAEEYARAVGVEFSQLSPAVYSANPMVVKIGGADFVRSIKKVNPDRSLSFFCAIDEGMVFNIARGVDLVNNLHTLFDGIRGRIGDPKLVIGFDCILRRLELQEGGAFEKASAVLRENNVIGFSGYGEQFHGMHVNQTFTGIAIGRAR